LKARAPVLIPRPETAFITELVTNSIASRPEHEQQEVDVVDLCTGSGCIALLLAHLLGPKLRRVRGYDISTEALELAQENARHHKLDDIVKIQHGDIFDSKLVKEIGKVDVVVSNPPYIPMNEWRRLPRGVREYEDPRALIGDPAGGEGDDQGLTFYRHIAGMLPHVLKPTGQVAVEIGLGHARDVRMILTDRGGMRRTEVWKDLFGVKRMVVGWR